MDTNELKNDLQGVFDRLKALEVRARKLQNQNLADIAASAHGKVKQLIDHPDTHLVADTNKDQSVNPDGSPRDDQKRPFGQFSTDANAERERAERDRVERERIERDKPAPQPEPNRPPMYGR